MIGSVHHADSRDHLKTLAENSLDSCVCDPPYALVSIGKRFGKEGAAKAKGGVYARASAGFMGQHWDTGETAFDPEFWAEVLRVLKPGGYCVAFGSSRTGHWLGCAMELGGFVMHPMMGWIFGSGFPKAHDAAKAIDKALGQQGAVAASGKPVRRIRPGADQHRDGSWEKLEGREYQPGQYVPATDEAATWQGWAYGGQATKPALEPIFVGQKPFSEKNGALNILKWGTGALNIDGCRVETAETWGESGTHGGGATVSAYGDGLNNAGRSASSPMGRWPANVIHDGSEGVVAEFPETSSGGYPPEGGLRSRVSTYGEPNVRGEQRFTGSEGSASRFFYSAKAGPYDRFASKHPTVKPVELMRWLCRLVTPPGGTILDPFAGSGTTGAAAMIEGFNAVLIERETEYVADIRRRLEWMRGDGPLTEQALTKAQQIDPGPLFGSAA